MKAGLCWAVPGCAGLCRAVPCRDVPCRDVLCRDKLCLANPSRHGAAGTILARSPAAWVWGGDNVYADRRRSLASVLGPWLLESLTTLSLAPFPSDSDEERAFYEPASEERLRALYAAQRAVPGYAALLAFLLVPEHCSSGEVP